MFQRIERVGVIPALATIAVIAFVAAQPWLPGWPAFIVAWLVGASAVLHSSRAPKPVTSSAPAAEDLPRRDPPRDSAPIDARSAEPELRVPASIAALYDRAMRSGLRQAALACEKAGELAAGGEPVDTERLLSLAHNLSVRGQELLERPTEGRAAADRREPFGLREDIAATARGLGFELGREIALRFSHSFPAQALADRVVVRLGVTAIVLEAAERAPDAAELLLEASHEDLVGANVNVRVAVSATGQPTIGEMPRHVPRSSEPSALNGLGQILGREGGHLVGNAEGTELGFSFTTVRYKKVTGTTLYGLGALSDRTVLVVDPRPIGRVTICEQLAAWRLAPTGVASIEEAQAIAARVSNSNEKFDLVVVSGFPQDQSHELVSIAARLADLKFPKVVSLEDLDSVCSPLHPELAALDGLTILRMARPPNPSDFIQALTELLVAKPEQQPETSRRGSGLSLLLAEDDNVNRALLVKMLERHGHSVEVTTNGADLVDRLWEAPGAYDAVLMDIQMPIMDGYEAAAVIRLREAQSQRPRIPIIAVTAHALGGERERCLEAGMDGYLAKPIGDKDLSLTLDTLATQPNSASSNLASVPPAPKTNVDVIFDRERVLELAAGDDEFLRGLAEMFGESAPKLVETIGAALGRGDGEAAYRAAHQLKGSIGNFGADRARMAAAKIEELARRGEIAEAATRMASLKSDVDELVAALRALAREL